MIMEEEQRDRAQGECWGSTVKGIEKDFGFGSLQAAKYLLNLIKTDKKRVRELFNHYNPYWAKILEETGGIK